MKKVDIKLIKNGDYTNTYYNDERFLLVDEYTIINGDYYEVDDLETVNELYDLAYLNEPDIYYGLTKFVAKVPMTIAFSNLQEIEDKVKNNIFKYTIEKLKMIGCSASEEYLQSRLEKALFYYGDNRFFTHAAAAYHPDFNMVVVPFDSFTVDLVFHETIHAISNVKHLYRLGLGSQENKQESLLMFSRTISTLQNKAREQKYQERLDKMEKKTMIMLFGTGGGILMFLLMSIMMMLDF